MYYIIVIIKLLYCHNHASVVILMQPLDDCNQLYYLDPACNSTSNYFNHHSKSCQSKLNYSVHHVHNCLQPMVACLMENIRENNMYKKGLLITLNNEILFINH